MIEFLEKIRLFVLIRFGYDFRDIIYFEYLNR